MLRLERVCAGYGRAPALQQVDLRVDRGETVALLGPNGAGKSTLLAAITGTLARREGAIYLEGENIAREPSHRIIARGVALVPEGRLVFAPAERRSQAAGTLSGGEQQMLAIGRALMSAPRLLLLDEPFLGLAPLVVSEIRRSLEELRAAGLTLLMVEQKLDIALPFAQRAYVLIKGRVVLEDSTAGLAQRPDLSELYFSLATSSASARSSP
ncbi:MAG: ABC transporter ATP-binding protein [Betaproteobacteria bacterium]|nr:MAG: ABC transporter ATP-binding protein [Betaproteobacteria bacterium]